MQGIRRWMSDHGEVVGILVFVLMVTVIGGASYGISYAAGGGSGKKNPAPSSAETLAAGNPTESSSAAETEESPSAGGNGPSIQPLESGAGESEPVSTSAAEGGGTVGSMEPAPSEGGAGGPQSDTFTEHGVHFQAVDEQVTAKIETNLRRVPSTEKDEDVVAKIYNGDWIKRTGIGHNGWSRVEYEGQVLYAVTSYLSVDGSSSSAPTYQEASDSVTAKEEVYLRSVPDSSSDENVVATLSHGEFVSRTGIGSNGWSRLDYNGTEVYAVTSLLTTE
ncbi:MAG: hypothetical protein HFI66_09085 [Lachnospiraceae bacterium]|jgi:uncharacterized protein YgiM (DUF1202 family)|nr:hypothetical protein [Lachnospiraceae bacterium]